jgi:hypothetical protein
MQGTSLFLNRDPSDLHEKNQPVDFISVVVCAIVFISRISCYSNNNHADSRDINAQSAA